MVSLNCHLLQLVDVIAEDSLALAKFKNQYHRSFSVFVLCNRGSAKPRPFAKADLHLKAEAI